MKFFFISILVTLNSIHAFSRIGSNNDYHLISEQDYANLLNEKSNIAIKKYIVVPVIDKDYKSIDKCDDFDKLIGKYFYVLYKNKKKYIKYNFSELVENEKNFLNGLFHFSINDYRTAIMYLETVKLKKYSFLIQLLIADSTYEQLEDKKNYGDALKVYQDIYDNYTEFYQRELIRNRIKNLKYRS